MKLYRHYLIQNNCYKAGRGATPVGIVVHDTAGGNKSLGRYIDLPELFGVNKFGNHWNQPMPGGRNVCVHAFIGEDKSGNVCTCEVLPYEYSCWGCSSGSKGSYNTNPTAHIQFEICDDGYKSKDYFTKAFREAAEYCAYLCKKFGFDPKTDIVSHKEAYAEGYASNHGDCDGWLGKFGYNMDDFRTWVYNIMYPVKSEPVCFPICQYTGTSISAALLSIGADASIGYRAKIAKKNGIALYVGAAVQNAKLLTLLKTGKLIKP
jgi:hypothetical protein